MKNNNNVAEGRADLENLILKIIGKTARATRRFFILHFAF
jgi:hypothetical protein